MDIVSIFNDPSVASLLAALGGFLFFFSFVEFGPIRIADREKKWARLSGVIFLVFSSLVVVGAPQEIQQVPLTINNVVVPASALTPPSLGEDVLTGTPLPSATITTAVEGSPTPTTLNTDQILEPASPTSTLTSVPSPVATSTPEPIVNVVGIPGYAEQGVQVNIPASGTYRVLYVGDAYSPWPSENEAGYRGWTSMLNVYLNRAVEWGTTDFGLEGPINQDYFIGPGEYLPSVEEVEAHAEGYYITLDLNAGDYLILIPIDEREQFSDNRGQVDIGIMLVK